MKRILYAVAVVAFVLAMFLLPTLSHAQTYCVGGQCYQQSTSYPGGWQQVGSVSGPLGIMNFPVVDYSPPQTVTQSVIVPSTSYSRPTYSVKRSYDDEYNPGPWVCTDPETGATWTWSASRQDWLYRGVNDSLRADSRWESYVATPSKTDQRSRTRTRAGDVCRCGCVNCRCENCTCRR